MDNELLSPDENLKLYKKEMAPILEKVYDRQYRFMAAVRELIKKIDEVDNSKEYRSVWASYYVHGGNYTGPQYGEEIKKVKEILDEIDGKAKKG